MRFFKNLFKPKDASIQTYQDFWNWFGKQEKEFYEVVRSQKNIERNFFDRLAPKLNELKDGIWYLTGMYNENTVELVLTADGVVKNIVFIEDLIAAAPATPGWKFTALKPALEKNDVSIKMNGYDFNFDNLYFYANEHDAYPDQVDITIIYANYTEENKAAVTNGIFIYLDNYLGELDFATTIDNVEIAGRDNATRELIAIEKLKAYLQWRQKEFIEKYEDVRHEAGNDQFSLLEAQLENGNRLIAAVNTDLLNWDGKASHPWILTVEVPYDGSKNNGLPNEASYQQLNAIEDEITAALESTGVSLYIGRQTASNKKNIYFACKDFRMPSKLMHQLQGQHARKLEISYEIYKDKYWQSFERFNPVP